MNNANGWHYDYETRNVLDGDGGIVCRNGDSVYGDPGVGKMLASVPELIDALRKLVKTATMLDEALTDWGMGYCNKCGERRCSICGARRLLLEIDKEKAEGDAG